MAFGLYVNEVPHYIERFWGSEACLGGIAIQILPDADDIDEEQQRHLHALKVFCMEKSLSINMDKTKVMLSINAMQMGSPIGHYKGVTIDRAIAICRARRSWPHGPRCHHPCD